MRTQRAVWLGVGVAGFLAAAGAALGGVQNPPPARAQAPAAGDERAQAREMVAKAVAYLRTQQDRATGGWSVPPAESQRPGLPAITALVLNGMRLNDTVAQDDDTATSGLKYLLNHAQADGGIYDRILPSYNTAIALSALARFPDNPMAAGAVRNAQNFLRGLQFSEGSDPNLGGREAPEVVDRSHPFYGGVGYGNRGRPDISNLGFMLQGLHDSGISGDDPAFQRALVFLQRTQMHEDVNDMPYARGSRQGGFIYATGENRETMGQGQSFAGTIEETMDDGTRVSRLRAYGSVTYVGFKSYAYADLRRDDPRVVLARRWLTSHYTLDENPGLGTDGQYYYYLMMARALDAWNEGEMEVRGPDGEYTTRDWRKDLIAKLAELQNPDGSFRSLDDRWMEDNSVLITAYSLIALQHALSDLDEGDQRR